MAQRTTRQTRALSATTRSVLALSVLIAVPLAGCAKPTAEVANPAATGPAPSTAPVDPVTPQPEPTPVQTPSPTPPAVAPTPEASEAPTRTSTPRATKSATPQPTKAAAGPAILARGASGDSVRDLQARLKQIGWFGEKVTGSYGPTTASAVAGFQAKRGLPATGAVDRATLTALQQMTRTPSAEDKADEPKPAPTQKPGTSKAPAEAGGVPAGVDPRCMTGRVLCISKSQNKLRWVVDGKVQTTLAVRFGTKELPTREGNFSVQWKSRDHVSNIYHTPMPYALFFSGGQAVHYSPDFAANGYSGGSHGCVNVRDKATMARLFDTVKVGDKVIVYR